jgi:hypothetical protein
LINQEHTHHVVSICSNFPLFLGKADLTSLFSKTPIGMFICFALLIHYFIDSFLHFFIHVFRLDLISKKLFAKASLSAGDLKRVMELRNEEVDVDDQVIKIKTEPYHNEFFKGPIMETIQEMTDAERSYFVYFCTGNNYLPNDKKFRIFIEFSLDNDALPVVHTCEQHLRLPRNAYNGSKTLFQEKLKQAMSGTGCLMTIN